MRTRHGAEALADAVGGAVRREQARAARLVAAGHRLAVAADRARRRRRGVAVVIAVVDSRARPDEGCIGELSLIPWLLALAAAMLLLGFLTAVGCQNMAVPPRTANASAPSGRCATGSPW